MNLNRKLINIRHIMEMLISLKLFREVSNWHVLLTDYLGLIRRGEKTVELNSGIKLHIRIGTTDKWPIHEIMFRDDYQIKNNANEMKVVIDLGANIGVFSIFLASLNNKVKVYAFEPEPENYKLLIGNIKQNSLSSQINCFQEACSQNTGEKTLYLVPNTVSHSFLKNDSSDSLVVKTQSLRDIFKKNRIDICDLLKLDVQGAEYEILYSLDSSTLDKIRNISLEYHNLNTKDQHTGADLRKYLVDQGFRVTQTESIQKKVGNLFAENKR